MSHDPVSPVSLYLHVPFCRTKCAYCDFTSATDAASPLPDEGIMWAIRRDLGPDATLADAFCEAVPLFLQEFADRGLFRSVPSIYVGGGTPTVLGERLPTLIARVLGLTTLSDDAEVTVEANPDSVTPALVDALRAVGVNRFSLGVQSFDPGVLRILGRCHTAEQAEAAAAIIASSGAEFSVDLICGVPGLDEAAWRDSVSRAVATGAGHLSVYPLSVEDATPLAARIEAGELPDVDPDEAARHMEIAQAMLADAGFERYEVASYARPGKRARHNVGYWTGVPYLGVGPGAASMLPVPLALMTPMDHYLRTWPSDWRARFVMNDSLASFLGYLWDRQPASLEPLSGEDAAREDAMLGMRMSDGISTELATSAGVGAVLESLAADGLVVFAEGRWRTTGRGWLLGNEVFERIWSGS